MTQRTLIVGLGVTGLSCLRHLAGTDELTLWDTRSNPPGLQEAAAEHPEAAYRMGDGQGPPLQGFDRIVMSPGVSMRSPLAQRIQSCGRPVLSDIDLFCRAVDEPIFAVTGTNGKSTVTTLAGHALGRLNHRPGVGGNLGEAALDVIRPDCDCYVLELSSFQLERMQSYPYKAATVLNISADHLDHYAGLDDYISAKQHIYRRAERLVANREDPRTHPLHRTAAEVVTFGRDAPAPGHWGIRVQGGRRWLAWGRKRLTDTRQLSLAGAHNEANALAALALIQGEENGGILPELGEALLGYRGLAHRCELLGVIDGVAYINDSKATNPGATLAALASFAGEPGATVLIAGGVGKGANFHSLGQAIGQCARCLVVLGQDGGAIAEAVGGRVPVLHGRSLADAVRQAAKVARPGDRVLLSPACASFDLFTGFQARGDAFRTLVEELRT